MTEDYIPLETGLKWAISFNKGCYVGQEVIARMETRQRLAKRLVVLGFSDANVAVGDEVRAGDMRVGQVTSVAPLVDRGTMTALAYVKTDLAQAGRELGIFSDDGLIAGKVLTVPGTR
jgi:folate-binding protein YgfZ